MFTKEPAEFKKVCIGFMIWLFIFSKYSNDFYSFASLVIQNQEVTKVS